MFCFNEVVEVKKWLFGMVSSLWSSSFDFDMNKFSSESRSLIKNLAWFKVTDSDFSWGCFVFIVYDGKFYVDLDVHLSIWSLSKLDEFELRGLCDDLCQILAWISFTEVNAGIFWLIKHSERIIQIESFKSTCRTIRSQDLHQLSSLCCCKHAIVHDEFF